MPHTPSRTITRTTASDAKGAKTLTPTQLAAAAKATNTAIFTDCLSPIIYQKYCAASSSDSSDSDASDLAEFIDYLTTEVFTLLPTALQVLTPADPAPTISAAEIANITPLSFSESLVSYGIVRDTEGAERVLAAAVEEFIVEARREKVWVETKRKDCEICEREGRVTYHHLIPRSTHAKVLRRGWHPEYMLNSVAWLCGPCHSMCHKVADNETLAREFYTVEKLLEREDMQRWALYQSKQRWKGPKRM